MNSKLLGGVYPVGLLQFGNMAPLFTLYVSRLAVHFSASLRDLTTLTNLKFSRFVNLSTLKIPPLTFGHTKPAIAYTSGKYSLPSAATRGGRSAIAGSLEFSRFVRRLCLRLLKDPTDRFGCKPLLTGSRIGTQHTWLTTSPELRNETRTRTRIP